MVSWEVRFHDNVTFERDRQKSVVLDGILRCHELRRRV